MTLNIIWYRFRHSTPLMMLNYFTTLLQWLLRIMFSHCHDNVGPRAQWMKMFLQLTALPLPTPWPCPYPLAPHKHLLTTLVLVRWVLHRVLLNGPPPSTLLIGCKHDLDICKLLIRNFGSLYSIHYPLWCSVMCPSVLFCMHCILGTMMSQKVYLGTLMCCCMLHQLLLAFLIVCFRI